MPMRTYRALTAILEDSAIEAVVELRRQTELAPGEVRIQAHYSSVKFKDALAFTPRGGVVRNYPIVPGIDVVGVVAASRASNFQVGDEVIAHGYDIGQFATEATPRSQSCLPSGS